MREQDSATSLWSWPNNCSNEHCIFEPLKEAIGGKTFHSDEEMQEAVREWLRTRPKEFFSRGIQAIVKRCRTFIERNGDYV
jgi:hypothetical protein